MAGKANFSVIKGDTFIRNVTFQNKSTGTAVNLSGATITGKIRKSGSTDVSFTCVITNAAQGKFSFGLTADATGALSAGTWYCEVQVVFADLTVKTLFNGNFIVQEQIV